MADPVGGLILMIVVLSFGPEGQLDSGQVVFGPGPPIWNPALAALTAPYWIGEPECTEVSEMVTAVSCAAEPRTAAAAITREA
jgi:hypothetical protein